MADIVTVACAAPFCPSSLRVHGASRYQASLIARVEGWRRIRSRHFCPGCCGRTKVRVGS